MTQHYSQRSARRGAARTPHAREEALKAAVSYSVGH